MSKTVPLATGAVALALAGIALAGVATAGSTGSAYTVTATMAAKFETPRPKAPARAKGLFTGTVTKSGSTRTLKWKLTFSGLSGKAVGAHVHKGKAGVAGAVLVPLCGPCRSGQTGALKISRDAADALEHGLTYVNVHTARNAAGEVRGQVKVTGDHSASTPPSGSTSPATTAPDDGSGGYVPGY
jgi:hypothetical protein